MSESQENNMSVFESDDTEQFEVSKKRVKGNKSALVLLYSFVIFLILVVAAFVGSQAYFRNRVAPGVHFAGSSEVSGAQIEKVADAVNRAIENTKIEIKDDSGKISVETLKDLSVSVDKSATVQNIMRAKHNNVFTMLMPWLQENVGLKAKLDNESMDAYIVKKFVSEKDRAMPYTAKFDSSSNSYVVEDGVPGRTIITLPVREAIKRVLENPGKTVKVTVGSRRVEAPIKRDVAQKTVDQLNNLLSKKITLDNGDSKDFTLSKAVLASWIKIDADCAKKKISYKVDASAADAWLSKELAKNLNQQKVDQEDTYNKQGKFILTTLKGENGIEVKYSKDFANKVVQAVEKSADAKLSVPTNVVKFGIEKKTVDMRVVVNKSNQTISVYKDDQLLKTFPVCSGSNGYYETPNGTYFIYLRYRVQDMRGFNRNGSRYFLPGITWVSYFNGGISFHTALWNNVGISQGYPAKYGSHGCINMYEQDAKWVFENCPRGTVVEVVGEQPDGPVR